GGANAREPGRERHALGMVAGGRGDDSGRLLRIREPGEPVVCAADFERAGPLEVLHFEAERTGQHAAALGQAATCSERSMVHDSANGRVCRGYVAAAYETWRVHLGDVENSYH